MAHDEVIERYSGLARAALAGETVVDCGPDAFADGCFGAAGYDDTAELPDGALRASLGCGNPVAVAELRTGRDRARSGLRRRHRRAAVGAPGRPAGQGLRAGCQP